MSKLSELLKLHVRTAKSANHANPAEHAERISSFSIISSGVAAKSDLPNDLELRVREMAARWEYTVEELSEALRGATDSPESWLRWVTWDETWTGGGSGPFRLN